MPDVFLSYSSNDNFFPENWVNSFHESLEKIARVYVGRQSFRVWKDTRDLNGNDLPQTIKEELDKSKLFMTLISPSYIVDENKWCTLERDHFIYKVVGDLDKSKPRIFAVLKLYDEDDEGRLPLELRSQFRYRLCKLNESNDPEAILPTDPEWKKCLISIAKNIDRELRKLENAKHAPAENDRMESSVFLANTRELYDEQLKIKAELEIEGITVNSLIPNISNINVWKEEFLGMLAQSSMSIHLIGATYYELKSAQKSVEELQWSWAVEYARTAKRDFTVITWVPKFLSRTDQRQKTFIDSITSGPDLPAGHDFMEKNLEEFLISVKSELKK